MDKGKRIYIGEFSFDLDLAYSTIRLLNWIRFEIFCKLLKYLIASLICFMTMDQVSEPS